MNQVHAIRSAPVAATCLVIGARGYVGRRIVASAIEAGVRVTAAVRPGVSTLTDRPGELGADVGADVVELGHGAALDEVLARSTFDQVVVLPQLDRDDMEWMIDRIDGPRWLVFSSAQLDSPVASPGSPLAKRRERLAVKRGAVVIRPTMIFGRGGDANISRLIAQLHRTRVPVQIGDGTHNVQPIHVDDVVSLVHAHRSTAARPGVYPVGGADQLPAGELTTMLCELLGVRLPPLTVRSSWISTVAAAAPAVGLRRDQIERLLTDKVVDDQTTRDAFSWHPAPLAHRLEQAVDEVLGVRV